MAQPLPEPDWQTVNEFIRQHPGGAGFEDIASLWGVSHQRIQGVARTALRRLHRHLLERGLTIDLLVVGSLQGESIAADVENLGEK